MAPRFAVRRETRDFRHASVALALALSACGDHAALDDSKMQADAAVDSGGRLEVRAESTRMSAFRPVRFAVDLAVSTTTHALSIDASGSFDPAAALPADTTQYESRVELDENGNWSGATMRPFHCAPIAVAGSGTVLRVPRDYPTIPAAIAVAKAGDTVSVGPGIYRGPIALKTGVWLRGAGADTTILDGEGRPENIIDFTDASGAVIEGFTFRNTGAANDPCPADKPLNCSGNWHRAAIYADGHNSQTDGCTDTSAVIAHNVFVNNAIAIMAYFHSRVVVRNNIFMGNGTGFAASSLQDHAVILNNVFYGDGTHAIASGAGYVDILANVFANTPVAIVHEYIQTGRIRCNLFSGVANPGERVTLGADGNLTLGSVFNDLSQGDLGLSAVTTQQFAGCLAESFDNLPSDYGAALIPGAFGGILGPWPGGAPTVPVSRITHAADGGAIDAGAIDAGADAGG